MANKGGVGKTGITLGLAGAAAHRGLAVLVIDLDPQGNATSHLKTRKGRLSLADVLASPDPETFIDAISICDWDASIGEVDVLPSHPDIIRYDAWSQGRSTTKLRRAMNGVEGYDLVLIDCPPSLGALTREALTAADKALIITTPSYFGAQGVEKSLAEITEIHKTTNPELQLAGIVMNRFRPTAEEHTYRLSELNEIVGARNILKPLLPERMVFQQAEGSGAPVQAIPGVAAREVSDILNAYLAKLLREPRVIVEG
jgi:MinD-like ATPase involved in chromosome partitioning or flagellar assembly